MNGCDSLVTLDLTIVTPTTSLTANASHVAHIFGMEQRIQIRELIHGQVRTIRGAIALQR